MREIHAESAREARNPAQQRAPQGGSSGSGSGGGDGSVHDISSSGDEPEADARTDLHEAAAEGDRDMLEELLSAHPEQLNSRDANGWQPLHEAVRFGDVDTVK